MIITSCAAFGRRRASAGGFEVLDGGDWGRAKDEIG